MIIDYAYLFNGDLFKQLIASIPKGSYFDNRADIIPFEKESEFRLETEYVNEVHYVSIACEHGENQNFTIVPTSKNYSIRVKLPQGLNTIAIVNDNASCVKSFCSTYFGTLLYAFSKELNTATTRLDRLTRDIFKQESTRLTSPVQKYASQLPDKSALRIFGVQLITRALINSPGTFESLENICKALYISTPKIDDIEQKDVFDLSYYSFSGQEYELGKLVYLWVRNPSLIRKLYGAILANNFNIDSNITETTLENNEGHNEYESSDSPILVDSNGFSDLDYSDLDDKPDGYVEIDVSFDLSLSRYDRNLPIPFTRKHPWYDSVSYENRTRLDEDKSLDIATWLDPLNKGKLGEQFIPYRYDGSKVTSLIELVKASHLAVGFGELRQNAIRQRTGYILQDSAGSKTGTIKLENYDASLLVENA